MSNYTIQELTDTTHNDVYTQIARIHMNEIPGGFLSQLGERFLVLLYSFISTSPYSFLVVAVTPKHEVLGFIAGSSDTKKLYKAFVIRNTIHTLPLLVKKFLNPNYIKKMMETLVYPHKKSTDTLPDSEILNFCVSNRYQHSGVGQKLFDALCDIFSDRGIPKIKIITGSNQVKAHNFYEKNGARCHIETEIHANVKSFIYLYDISTTERRQ